MRRKLVVGNWKMNMTLAQASACVEGFLKLVDAEHGVDVGVAPGYLALNRIAQTLNNTHVKVGGQDVFWMPSGAFTGLVSVGMLKDAGATFCIIGHSERRGRFGKLEVGPETLGYFPDTDHTINLKLRALLYEGMVPILCVGETLAERDAGATETMIEKQLAGALDGFEAAELTELVVAYEPVWAIGTGNVCDTHEANRVCGLIRGYLEAKGSKEIADSTRILYGGSVKASNAKELFSQTHIDGGLVGGASLDAAEFSQIVQAAH
jgi:triosephosphate isomerase